MKLNITTLKLLLITVLLGSMASCSNFLNREPISEISPEHYFKEASQLEANLNDLYPQILPSHDSQWNYGMYGWDSGTDNQIGVTADDKYTTDRYLVPSSGGNWSFNRIYYMNFFLENVFKNYGDDPEGSQNTITGDLSEIQHYIGEMYFLRAYRYFARLQEFGDYPIVKKPMVDDRDELIEASKRKPCNEVARFIITDLDSAIYYMSAVDMPTTRVNKDVALLLKSRVALFEGTWLKNFKGTPFVPKGDGWPGATKDYNADYEYPSGSIDAEIEYFLNQAIDASKQVADKYAGSLTENTGEVQQSASDAANPFHEMFASEDLSGYSEVMLWRQYARSISTHNVNLMASRGNYRVGVTKGLVNSFLMKDGTPIYTHGTCAYGDGYYHGDTTIAAVRINRDPRLSIFLKEPGQKNVLYNLDSSEGSDAVITEPIPQLTVGDSDRGYSTGYALRKGGSYDKLQYNNGGGYTAAISFRSAEALLNYMEASYELKGTLDADARTYWQALRRRAGVSEDIDATIAATDMTEEAKNDWGAYTAGVLIDPTLYNIRRERRCEFMAEGLRYMDLCRWRAMDQLKVTPYHTEGIHLWNTPMENWDYTLGTGGEHSNDPLLADGTSDANVSPESTSEYLRPHERYSGQAGFNGLTWMYAHYLEPVNFQEFQVTGGVADSPIYQNPYWSTESGSSAIE
ncbi:MAG: RagB/SusD family nutrient uptake outer membrane protein [Mangrovibacterium sp.]